MATKAVNMAYSPPHGRLSPSVSSRFPPPSTAPLGSDWVISGATVGEASCLGIWTWATCSHRIFFSSCVTYPLVRAGVWVTTTSTPPVEFPYHASAIYRDCRCSIRLYNSPEFRTARFLLLNAYSYKSFQGYSSS